MTLIPHGSDVKIKSDYWVHVYCLGFLTNNAESMTEWYCRKHHPIKMPSHKRVVKKI